MQWDNKSWLDVAAVILKLKKKGSLCTKEHICFVA